MPLFSKRIKHDFLEACSNISGGRFHLRTPEGETHDFGSGTPEADMHIHDWATVTACAARGDIGFGETYIAGLWDTSSIDRLAQFALRNEHAFSDYSSPNSWNALKFRVVDRILRANSVTGAARNIRAHYDVGNEFYQLWLDPSMTYSSAIFAPGDKDLLRAQHRKYDRILGRLPEGDRVLEVGCGWGGFAERAADQGRHVIGITISPSQKGYADARLDGRAEIRLQDYRKTDGKFDNIVSIEMIEAVGERYWPAYFQTLKNRLAEGGRAVVQAIVVQDDYFPLYRKGSDFIRQYTFPGGMLLSKSVIAEQARRAGLAVDDSFAFRHDYAQTLRHWSDAISDNAHRITRLGFGDAFLRNWQFYLGMCAGSFEVGQTDVMQVDLVHA